MSQHSRKNSNEGPSEAEQFGLLKQALIKKPEDRSSKEIDIIAENIYNLKYFKDIIIKENERLEFAKGCSKYLKYEHFPQGFEVFKKGDRGDNFYIILKGEAYVFVQKSEEEIQADLATEDKKKAFAKYMDYMAESLTAESIHKAGTMIATRHTSLDKRSKSFALPSASPAEIIFEPLHSSKKSIYARALLREGTRVFRSDEMKNDLTFEEKLLLLNNKQGSQSYLNRGVACYKKVNCLQTGDSFGELALIFNQPRLASIIASKDLHLLSITSNDFKEIFNSEIRNVLEKIDFFSNVFFHLSQAAVSKFCYLLEEKTYKFNDVIYKEGDVPDAIYIIKHGEIQLSKTVKQKEAKETEVNSPKRGGHQRRIVIANLVDRNFFGDFEVIMNSRRIYTATCTTTTFVYRLKKQSYKGIIENHFPEIAKFLKNQAEHSEELRRTRTEHNQKIQLLNMPTQESLSIDSNQKISEEVKMLDPKLKILFRKRSEFFPLNLKSKLEEFISVQKDKEKEEKGSAFLRPTTIERMHSLQPSGVFERRQSKVFIPNSLEQHKTFEQRAHSPVQSPKVAQGNQGQTFTLPSSLPASKPVRFTFSNSNTPDNRTSNHRTISTTANSSKVSFPQVNPGRGTFSGLNADKVRDLGFSSLVTRLKQTSPPHDHRNSPIIVDTPGRIEDMIVKESPKQLNNNVKTVDEGKNRDEQFHRTLANLMRIKSESPASRKQKVPEKERVNHHVQHKAIKIPFKQMKIVATDKNSRSVKGMPKINMHGSPSNGCRTERSKFWESYRLPTSVSERSEQNIFLNPVPIIDLKHIMATEQAFVPKNEPLSAKAIDIRIKKTPHNMFRTFRNGS